MQNRTPLALLSAALTCLVGVDAAQAQMADQRPRPLPALGRNVVSNSDTTTMVQNPANLAYLPGPELRWNGYFLGDSARVPSSGHAFALGFPLMVIPVSTGLRFEFVDPPSRAAQDMWGRDGSYQWLTWSLAAGTDTASVGFSFQRSYSDVAEAHGFGTWSTGINLRPSDYFGLAGTVNQVDSPASVAGTQLGTEYVMGAAVRPVATDLVEIGLEGTFVDENGGYWVPRATADVGIPGLGRLRGGVAWTDPADNVIGSSWIASTSLVIDGNTRAASAELAVGSRYGDGLGNRSADKVHENVHAELALRGFRASKGAENLPYAVRVRIEETPNSRKHTALLRKLWSMAEDEPNLRAVLFELRAAPADSLAHVQELQDAIYYLRSKGIKVACHIESGTGSALYMCSAADKFLVNPAGGIRYSGLKSNSFYIKRLLDKLGIRADFVRIGKHKSAPEMFTRTEGSDTAEDDRTDLLQQIEREMAYSIGTGRDIGTDGYRDAIRSGPFTAAEAKRAGLVDGFAFDDMLEDKVDDMSNDALLFEDEVRAPQQRERFGPRKKVAIVYVEGNMVDGRSKVFPFVGIRTAGSYTIAESLKNVREDPNIGAVVLRVETGGGSAMAADVIWREVQLTAAKKPVVVSMGSAAASGGYYISSPGTYIYANPLSITGSIGIFYGKFDVAGLLRKIGVNVVTLQTNRRANAESPFRPFSDEERAELKDKVEQFYGLFLRRVADSRPLSVKQVDAVGRGRVWTGRQAARHKLVDGLGGLRQALAKARSLAGMRQDSPVVELPKLPTTLIGKLLGIQGLKKEMAEKTPPLPGELMDMARAIAPYALYEPHLPLARIETLPQLIE